MIRMALTCELVGVQTPANVDYIVYDNKFIFRSFLPLKPAIFRLVAVQYEFEAVNRRPTD